MSYILTNLYGRDVRVDNVYVPTGGTVVVSSLTNSINAAIRKGQISAQEVVLGTRNNFNATTNPGVSNDSTQNYAVGSQWQNKTTKTLWMCSDASVGAAVWTNANVDIINNNEATSNPGIGDDSADGYSIGSTWWNKTAKTLWVASDVSSGAAVWNNVTERDSLNNLTASVDPAVGDDSVDGYSVGSMWWNATAKSMFIASDVSVGAAVWDRQVSVQANGTVIGAKSVSVVNSDTGVTLTAAQVTTGATRRTGTAGGGISDTLPTAAQLLAEMPEARVGDGFEIKVSNNVGDALTILTGAGLTLTGNVTLATATTRTFVVTFTNVTAASEAADVVGL